MPIRPEAVGRQAVDKYVVKQDDDRSQPGMASRNRKRIGRWSSGIRQLYAVLISADFAGCATRTSLLMPAE